MKNSIGQNIAYYRKKCGFTQEELSVKMNVTAQAVSKWENDLSYPDLGCIQSLAGVLNTTVNNLLSGEDDISGIAVSQNDDVKKKILLISVESKKENHPAKIKLRMPVEVILEAKNHELLGTFLDDSEMGLILAAIQSGSIGPIVDVESDQGNVKIEVVDYEG